MKKVDDVRRADTKKCNRCGVFRNMTEFYKRLDKENRCKPCVSKMRKQGYATGRDEILSQVQKYRKENPEKIRDTKLKQAYGVGVDYYEAKLKEQGGACGSCKKDVKTIWRGKEVRMALDHDHTTNSPRGILCIKCNRALGLLEENIDIILSLVEYIRKYQK